MSRDLLRCNMDFAGANEGKDPPLSRREGFYYRPTNTAGRLLMNAARASAWSAEAARSRISAPVVDTPDATRLVAATARGPREAITRAMSSAASKSPAAGCASATTPSASARAASKS